jgi:hypothetical protein
LIPLLCRSSIAALLHHERHRRVNLLPTRRDSHSDRRPPPPRRNERRLSRCLLFLLCEPPSSLVHLYHTALILTQRQSLVLGQLRRYYIRAWSEDEVHWRIASLVMTVGCGIDIGLLSAAVGVGLRDLVGGTYSRHTMDAIYISMKLTLWIVGSAFLSSHLFPLLSSTCPTTALAVLAVLDSSPLSLLHRREVFSPDADLLSLSQ